MTNDTSAQTDPYGAPYGAYPPPRPPKPAGSKALYIVLGCLGVVVLVCLLAGVGLYLAWPSITSAGVSSDLTEYHTTIREMELAAEVKQELLSAIERIREKARKRPPALTRWVDYDKSIRSLIDNGKLDDTELKTLRRELKNLEAECDPSMPAEADAK